MKPTQNTLRTLAWVGAGLVGSLVAAYLYQPQRITLIPKNAPEPDPRVEPDLKALLAKNTRVAVVGAHPDDSEFYLGGTLTTLHQAGAKILIVVCTDGDKGYYPKFLTDANENRRVRRLEQIEAAVQYDADVIFLSKLDGRLFADQELVSSLINILNEFEPEYLLAFDTEFVPKIQHRDHVQSGVAALAAVKNVPSIKWILHYSTNAPNFFFDISELWPIKKALLEIHRSQFFGERLKTVASMVYGRARSDGERSGSELAEGMRASKRIYL